MIGSVLKRCIGTLTWFVTIYADGRNVGNKETRWKDKVGKNSVEMRRKARKPINDYDTSHLQFSIDVLIFHVSNSASSGTFAFRLRPLAD